MHRHVWPRMLAAAFLALLVLFVIPEAARSAVLIAAAAAIVALRQPRLQAWARAHLSRSPVWKRDR
jgi:hypothetical protein